jgi:hypothetical protein
MEREDYFKKLYPLQDAVLEAFGGSRPGSI